MVTQREVAKKAKVSQPVVSMVLNNDPRVSPATRARVEKAIEELGYVPNLMARGLVTRRTHVLSLVTPHLAHESEQFLMPILEGITDGLREKHFILNFSLGHPGEDSRQTIMRTVKQRRLDGIFILSPHEEEAGFLEFLTREKIPFILVNRRHEDPEVVSVSTDYASATRQALLYLTGRGHRKIGLINGPENRPSSQPRLEGYQAALEQAGICFDPRLIFSGNFQVNGGYQGTKHLLDCTDCTALFAGNDFQALGAYQALYERGRTPGRDMAIIGCDDWEMSEWLFPPLTTMGVPFYEMGRTAALMLTQLATGVSPAQRQTILPAKLVERKSVS